MTLDDVFLTSQFYISDWTLHYLTNSFNYTPDVLHWILHDALHYVLVNIGLNVNASEHISKQKLEALE